MICTSWQEKLPLVETDEESTWLFHEIGRCYLELKEYEEAKVYGELLRMHKMINGG